MAGHTFSYPFMYWVGMDTDPSIAPAALAEFNRFYSTTHVGEVVAAHPGFVSATRYELEGQGGPRWLAVYGMADEAAAQRYLKDNERPWLHRKKYSPWPAARRKAKTVWRMLWQHVAAPAASSAEADTIVILGTNTPPPAPGESLAHLELFRAFAPPEADCPRYCLVYDGAADAPTGDAAQWRLVYRRIPPPA